MELFRLSAFIVFLLAVGYSVFLKYKNKPSLGESLVADKISDKYDYVIVGAGSAGSVLASRLSEEANASVLILEAGEHFDFDQNIHIPAFFPNMLQSKFAWHFQSETENGIFLGLKGRKTLLNKGKVLGGSSSINACVYARGSPFDFEEWVKAYGCTGWGYQDLLPYFKKAEDIQIPELRASEYHGIGGPIAVSESFPTPLSKHFINAGKEMGYMEIDYNGKSQIGFSHLQETIRNGVRSSTGLEYLGKPGKRQNLDIATNSFVTKIKVDKNVATGVYFIRKGRKQFVQAKRDIIISSGASNSPQLLMLSGIGPKGHLQEIGIPLIQDLPVGQKFDDHIAIFISAKINQSLHLDKEKAQGLWSKIQYAMYGTGPASTLSSVTAFFHIDKTKQGKERPDIMLIFLPTTFGSSSFLNYNDSVAEELIDQHFNTPGFTVIIVLLHSRSTGTVRLQSKDPFDSPIFNTNHLKDRKDKDDLLSGIRIAEEVLSTESMKSIGADICINKASFCSQHVFRSDDFWRCMIHHISINFFHTTSTCKMGRKGDPTAVVDLDLRVQGIKNLRVCDTSVFPTVTSANTNAATIAVAEKFADMLKKEMHQQKTGS